jgi:hypothetical protein
MKWRSSVRRKPYCNDGQCVVRIICLHRRIQGILLTHTVVVPGLAQVGVRKWFFLIDAVSLVEDTKRGQHEGIHGHVDSALSIVSYRVTKKAAVTVMSWSVCCCEPSSARRLLPSRCKGVAWTMRAEQPSTTRRSDGGWIGSGKEA